MMKRDRKYKMELVYLWVEEYKNIHNQGFNFSPRFECDYKDETLDVFQNLSETMALASSKYKTLVLH